MNLWHLEPNGPSQDVINSVKETLPQVIETAFVILNGGYDMIANGGYLVLVMEKLTAHAAADAAPQSKPCELHQAYRWQRPDDVPHLPDCCLMA